MTSNKDVFNFIVKFMEKNRGLPPTRREIANGMGITSTAVVNHHLTMLNEQGEIEITDDSRSRNIVIPNSRWELLDDDVDNG